MYSPPFSDFGRNRFYTQDSWLPESGSGVARAGYSRGIFKKCMMEIQNIKMGIKNNVAYTVEEWEEI